MPGIYERPPAATVPTVPRWQAALAKVRAGVADARVLCIGDSTTYGTGTVAHLNSYPVRLAGLMTAAGITTSIGSTFGIPVSVLDPRVTVGALWTGSGFSVYGNGGFGGAVGGGLLSFTPTETFDTIDVIHFQGPAIGGTSTINVDGGASLGNISGVAGTNQIVTTSFTCAAGTHTINIASPTVAPLLIVGIEVRHTGIRRVRVDNTGHAFTTTTDWAGNSFTVPALAQLAPDLTIINLSKNDAGASTPWATVAGNLTTLITAARLTGDVVLCSPLPSKNGTTNYTFEAIYRPLIEQLAATLGVRYLNLSDRWTSWAVANARGLEFDNLHPTAAGYADVAAAAWELLGPVS